MPILPTFGSAAHVDLIKLWLEICDKSHKCMHHSESYMPTRVLDVGCPPGKRQLKLHCSTPNETGKYIALSHRWGIGKAWRESRLTSKTLAAFQTQIDFQKLPGTFQDAVIITRTLGIRFLWIDSLCIVQDNLEDWDREAKLMEDVFSSAYCTLAASDATANGFLNRPRKPRRIITMSPSLESNGYPYYVAENIDDFHGDVEESELNQRGWVLQERALSPRTVHFTKNQTYWECGNGVRSETLAKLTK